MSNAMCGKTMENLRNSINGKLVTNEKDYLKCTSKRSCMSQKIFGNNLAAIRKSKLALKLNKPTYIRMCILELSKVLMYKFHYDYKSKLLFKTEDVYEDFSSDKEMFDFSNYSTKLKYYDNSNKLVIGKMKDETASTVIEGFVGLKPMMYSFLLDNNEHKKANGVNKNHNEYKDVLLNEKCKDTQ